MKGLIFSLIGASLFFQLSKTEAMDIDIERLEKYVQIHLKIQNMRNDIPIKRETIDEVVNYMIEEADLDGENSVTWIKQIRSELIEKVRMNVHPAIEVSLLATMMEIRLCGTKIVKEGKLNPFLLFLP